MSKLESRWGDSNRTNAETWITLREFKSKKIPRFESRWGDSSRRNAETRITLRGFKSKKFRDLNHVEGIQTGQMLRLESRWGDSSRKNLYDSNHVEGIQALQPHPASRLLDTIWAQKSLDTSQTIQSLSQGSKHHQTPTTTFAWKSTYQLRYAN
jgi:hypothetical protein